MAKIFLMEDSPPLRRVLVRQIRDAGHTVAAFENGEQSRNRGIVGDADLLITDLSMPEVDGETVIRTVSRLRPKLPIIVIGGHIPDHIAEMKGVKSVLRKPFSEDKLIEVIEMALKPSNSRRFANESQKATQFIERVPRNNGPAPRSSWISLTIRRLTGRRRSADMLERNELKARSLDDAPVIRSRERT